jgi:hypothetical protein
VLIDWLLKPYILRFLTILQKPFQKENNQRVPYIHSGIIFNLNNINQIFMAITKESIKMEGEKVLNKVKELVKEGNVRKISIHEKDGKELMSFPLSLGVVGAVFAPVLAAVGALAALIGECTITVEREEKV